MAVRIRMKKMGRRHRPFFRICAVDGRRPRGGRVLEELGTYDPMLSDVDARALLKAERVDYWLGVGAQPSDKVGVLIKKYGSDGTHIEAQRAARERLALPRVVPDAGKPAYVPPEPEAEAPPEAKQPEAKQPEAKQPEAAAETEATVEPAAEAPSAEPPETGKEAETSEASAEPAAEAEENKQS